MLANKNLHPQWYLWPLRCYYCYYKVLAFYPTGSLNIKKQMVSCRWKSSQHSQIPWTSSTESLVQKNHSKVWGVEPHSEEGNTKNPYFTIARRNYLCSFSRHKDIAWLFLLMLKFSKIIPRENLPARPMLEQFSLTPFPSTKLLFGECGFGQFSLLKEFFEVTFTQPKIFSQFSPPTPSVSPRIPYLLVWCSIVPRHGEKSLMKCLNHSSLSCQTGHQQPVRHNHNTTTSSHHLRKHNHIWRFHSFHQQE